MIEECDKQKPHLDQRSQNGSRVDMTTKSDAGKVSSAYQHDQHFDRLPKHPSLARQVTIIFSLNGPHLPVSFMGWGTKATCQQPNSTSTSSVTGRYAQKKPP
jgi:hypothetical protein